MFDPMEMIRGDICCLVAGVGFAVNYLPVKSCNTGDGIFFCAAMSVGILFVGLLTGMFLTSTQGLTIPAFEPLAALGGALWMLGNLMCPRIIQMIGLGLGLTMWDLSNMLVGWLIGRFGLFGIKKDEIDEPTLNLIGLILASVSLVFFSLSSVMNNPEVAEKSLTFKAKDNDEFSCQSTEHEPDPERTPHQEADLESNKAESAGLPEEAMDGAETRMFSIVPNVHPPQMERAHSWVGGLVHPRVRSSSRDLEAAHKEGSNKLTGLPEETTFFQLFLGSMMSIIAGSLFGTTFVLPVALKEGSLGGHHSAYIMDYVFSHFIGIFLTSTTALLIYVGTMRKNAYTPCNIVVPAIWSGVIWGIAQVAWFQANLDLGFSVAFPVVASLPGVIGLVIGICCFKEVESYWARIFAGLGLLLRIPGDVRPLVRRHAGKGGVEELPGDHEASEEQILKATKIMDEKLQNHFIFNFSDEAVVAPVIYGGPIGCGEGMQLWQIRGVAATGSQIEALVGGVSVSDYLVLKITSQVNEGKAYVQFATRASAEAAAVVPVLDRPEIMVAWLLRPKGKGSGKGKSDRPVENRVLCTDPEERRRLEENKVKREEVASRKTVLLANFTNQIKAIMAKLTDPKVSEGQRETLRTLLLGLKEKMDSLTGPGRPDYRTATNPRSKQLDLRTRLLKFQLTEETSLEALHEELRNLAGESGVRVWPDAEGSAVAQFKDRSIAEKIFSQKAELSCPVEWYEPPREIRDAEDAPEGLPDAGFGAETQEPPSAEAPQEPPFGEESQATADAKPPEEATDAPKVAEEAPAQSAEAASTLETTEIGTEVKEMPPVEPPASAPAPVPVEATSEAIAEPEKKEEALATAGEPAEGADWGDEAKPDGESTT
ncbi:Transmembrane protein 144 homolog [Durusdinium trenchii]|uniref:Transmembrane protein 144 homolog n=1 Tax=Durusdinium trenchii TaxID=1381693 RepID=A0ABP0QG68_9DINO